MKQIYSLIFLSLLLVSFLGGCAFVPTEEDTEILRFESEEQLLEALKNAKNQDRDFIVESLAMASTGGIKTVAQAEDSTSGVSYSDTNIQVEGVDEADVIKTDGEYIYVITQQKLIVVLAGEDAKIISTIELGEEFFPQEMFIHENRVMIFGNSNYHISPLDSEDSKIAEDFIMPPYSQKRFMTVKLFDTTDKENVELARNIDFEGHYMTSRKIGDQAYFVINSYPNYHILEKDFVNCGELMPTIRENDEEFSSIASCTEVGYVPDTIGQSFLTIASVSLVDFGEEVEKEVILGSGQEVYASLENLYVVQTLYPGYWEIGELVEGINEKTVITKFSLNEGEIEFLGTGRVPGHVLNQFSMDEHEGNFRIATTTGDVWGGNSENNVYILDSDLEIAGSLEGLAPGEKIYSVRFMGDRGYVVTFKKVDPLFVIDLEDAQNPKVLGQLKIPGYSDYLHPYDENHIIGIGKDTVEAEEDLIEQRGLDFAWYQGVKMAVFDVSDVENPIEMHKVVIGDRGTNSDALYDHKAFLFDREKNLLVLPITLSEIQGEKTADNQYGEFVFQGAYVYDIGLENGFELRGRITHYNETDMKNFNKYGLYFRGEKNVKRSLYIGDELYTMSDFGLGINDLETLEKFKFLEFGYENQNRYPIFY